MQTIDIFDDLHQFFAQLSPDQRDRLDAILRIVELPGEMEIARTSDAVNGIYLIADGALRLESFSEDGERFIAGFLEKGDVFGLLSVIDRKPSQHFVSTVGPTTVLFAPAEKFQSLVSQDAELSQMLAEMMCQRLRMALILLDRFGLGSRSKRVANCLLMLAEYYSFRPDAPKMIELQVTQYDLSAMLAVSRQSVNKELKELENAGLIDIRYGSIHIRDIAGLRNRI